MLENEVQSEVLKECVEKKRHVAIFLMNGFQVKGYIRAWDRFVISFQDDTKGTELIYKHAISTIIF